MFLITVIGLAPGWCRSVPALIEWLDHEAKLDLALWDFSHLKIFRGHRQFFVAKPSQAATRFEASPGEKVRGGADNCVEGSLEECNRKSVGRQK
jgi:hypothetical protein